MTNLEVQTLAELIHRAHQTVYGLASQGRRGDPAYQPNLDLLSQAIARGSEMMAKARAALGGSSAARIGERPPRGVEVATWQNFVRQFVAARTTWFSETQAGVALGTTGGSSMVMDAGYFRREATRLSQLHSPVYAAVSQGRAPAQAAFTALSSAYNGVRYQVNQHMTAVGATTATIASRPPRSLETATWQSLLATLNAVGRTLNTARSLAGGQQPARTAAPTAGEETPDVSALRPAGQQPAAQAATEQPARRQSQRTARGRASSGGGRSAMEMTLPEMAASATEHAQAAASEAFDTARGTFQAIRTVGQILTTTPGEILTGSSLTAPLRLADRLQAIVTVLNPPSVPMYERPWFWPTILGVTGYLGYTYYQSSQQKKPAPAKAKTTAATAATMPALSAK